MEFLKDSIKKINNHKFSFTILLLIFFVGLFLRVSVLIYNKSFWDDEMFIALNILSKNHLGLFHNLDFLQVCPPFFLIITKVILNLFGWVNDIYLKDVAFRILPCFCSVISIPIFAYLVNLLFKNKFVVWVSTALLAVNVGAINYAGELKQYSCEMLFTLILLIVFYKIDLINDTYKKILTFASIISVSIWFSIASFFIIPAGFLVLFIDTMRKIKTCLWKFMLLIGSFICVLFLYFKVYLSNVIASYTGMSVYWQNNFLNKLNGLYLFNLIFQYYFTFNLNKLIVLYIIVALLVLIFSKNYKRTLLLLLPILLTAIASMLHLWPMKDRLVLFLLPIFIIILCLPLKYIKKNLVNSCLIVGFIFIISWTAIAKGTAYYIPHKGPNREMAIKLYNNVTQNDTLIIDPYDFMWLYYVKPLNLNNQKVLFHLNNQIAPKEFTASDASFIKGLPKGNYWICYLYGLNLDFKNYLQNNNSIIILKEYKFVRSSDYKYLLYFKKL